MPMALFDPAFSMTCSVSSTPYALVKVEKYFHAEKFKDTLNQKPTWNESDHGRFEELVQHETGSALLTKRKLLLELQQLFSTFSTAVM